MVPFAMDWIRCIREFRREFRARAIQRLVERNISFEEIDGAIGGLEIVAEYADDVRIRVALHSA